MGHSRGIGGRDARSSGILRCCFVFGVLALGPGAGAADDPNACDVPGEAPDVILGNLSAVARWGTVGDITAYSLGPESCNIGSCWLNYLSGTPDHPVFGQNMFRLEDGKFEQIGQSWLMHGFFAFSNTLCSADCVSTNGAHLGVDCSNSEALYSGAQAILGPKSEVNPATGEFPYPFTGSGQQGNTVYKRLQVHNADLDPALHPGALYFVEGQLVARDDAAAGAGDNNVSYRPVQVSGSGGVYNVSVTGVTTRKAPMLKEWKDSDPAVSEVTVEAPDGLLILAAKATDLGVGFWHYEYAIQNVNSHRSAGSFSVRLPFGANVTHVGFHDVDYHSGEAFDGTDWTVAGGGPTDLSVTWSTSPFAQNPDANALRWGTLYNFRFDADVPPGTADIVIGLFRPGSPSGITVSTVAPRACDADGACEAGEDCTNCASDCADQGAGGGCCGDGTCDLGESPCGCLADCGPPLAFEVSCDDAADEDCDALTDCQDADCCALAACAGADQDRDGFELCDCNDADGQVWSTPGEIADLLLSHESATGETSLVWSPPLDAGATSVAYEAIRSINPVNFQGSTACLADADPTDTTVTDAQAPGPQAAYHYLVRAVNGCPAGDGPLGRSSSNVPHAGRSCP